MTSLTVDIYRAAYAEGWRPDPFVTVSEWADEHRYLPREVSESWGRWRTDRVPYLREVMDCLSTHHPARRVVFMKGSRLGATEAMNNALGYWVHQAPGPVLFMQPNKDLAEGESKDRVAPMLEDTPALARLVAPPRSRDSSNTIFFKEFPGGSLRMLGAESASGLRRISARYLLGDEIDEWPADVRSRHGQGGQGDSLFLAERRLITFARISKEFLASSPTNKGLSRIEGEYENSDQRRYFLPCPHCGHMDYIRWENIRWEGRDTDEDPRRGKHRPETASLVCVECQEWIPERFKVRMVRDGEWRPTAESIDGTIGFHLSSLYSTLGYTWERAVAEYLRVKGEPMKFKAWWNHVLALPWEERGQSADAITLQERVEVYSKRTPPAEVPHGVGLLTAGVDVQGDRLEVAVKGWGAGEESWLIAYDVIHGDPAKPKAWTELSDFLKQPFAHESGRVVTIEAAGVDTGFSTEDVYKFCGAHRERRFYAVKGGQEVGKPFVPLQPSRRNKYRIPLYTLCTDTGKGMVFSRLRIGADWRPGEPSPGPGFMHFPDWAEEEYFLQLAESEMGVMKYTAGRSRRTWVWKRDRNEALDCEVYALAALYILGPAWIRTLPERVAAWSKSPEAEAEDARKAEEAAQQVPTQRRRGWMSGATGR